MELAPFVDAAWLAAHRAAVVLADVRWYLDGRSGRAAYDDGHLPGAVFVDLDAALAAPPDPARGRHPLPEPQTFAAAMGALGIGDDDTVIAYDDAGGVIAARLVWMLRATGHAAALLDGGLQAVDGPMERAAPARPATTFTARPWPPELLADADAAVAPGVVLLDARPAERYAGAADDLDPRAGHIPGARSIPCREHLGPDGRLLGREALRERLRAAGVTPGADVVSSCGSGVTACHNLLVAEHVGLGSGRLFPGSWSQWSRDPKRLVARGSEPF